MFRILMKYSALLTVTMLLVAFALPAQEAVQPIFHEKPACMWSDDEPFLAATVISDGETRAYYRIKGAADWCYVVGDRVADRAFFILPEFSKNVTIQYFFLSHIDETVTGRSDHIYEVTMDENCRRRPARHEALVISDCETAGGLGAAIGSALQVETDTRLEEPSPFEPQR